MQFKSHTQLHNGNSKEILILFKPNLKILLNSVFVVCTKQLIEIKLTEAKVNYSHSAAEIFSRPCVHF